MSDIQEILENASKSLGITLNDQELQDFENYANLLVKRNKEINLTSITELHEIAIKHFLDSIILLKEHHFEQGSKVIDIGTGAGFPGIPLKIMRPDLQMTLMDSLNKRVSFLSEVCDRINIKANCIHMRAEDGAQLASFRDNFDIATSRAVARMNILLEYALPYVKVGGCFIAMKGPHVQTELNESINAITTLGGYISEVKTLELPDGSQRSIVFIIKVAHTPEIYPRSYAKISKKPL